MSQGEFERTVQHIHNRMFELRAVVSSRDESSDVAEEALEELAASLEELTCAEDELRRQAAELARSHAALELERRRYHELFWTAPTAFVTTDPSGVIGEANRAAGDLLGSAPHFLIGRSIASFVDVGDRGRLHDWLRAAIAATGTPPVLELRMRPLGNGRGFPVVVQIARTAAGERRDALRWALVDQSDRERVREGDRAREESRRKDEFLAILGHELRNPLAAIALGLGVLEGADLATGSRERWALDVLHRHADRLRHLIDDLLEASRAAHGKIALRHERVDLREIIAEARDPFGADIDAKQLAVEVRAPAEPVIVTGDRDRLAQVLGNVLDNAIRHSEPGGAIAIDLTAEDERATIRVRDHGAGIRADRLEDVFAPFEQGGGGQPSAQGLGLGLSLARALIEMHGGEVAAYSEGPGRGTELVIELPRGLAGARASTADGAAPSLERPLRVLVADDNADAAEILGLTLGHLGHETSVVHDGRAALRRLADGFDIAVLDLGMPGLSGFDVARQARERYPALRLIAITGYGDPTSRSEASAAGFDHYVVKPFDVAAVDRLLRAFAMPSRASGSPPPAAPPRDDPR